uniref:RegA n=1 Tax=Yamagishiella unicocca TaxID=51707 RepID=A0A1W6R6P2_9CHLO|nr:RegA [Yamagishiella unicocca]
MEAESSEEGNDGIPAASRPMLQQEATGALQPERLPSRPNPGQPLLLATGLGYGTASRGRAGSIPPTPRGPQLALRPILPAGRTMEGSPPAPQPLQPLLRYAASSHLDAFAAGHSDAVLQAPEPRYLDADAYAGPLPPVPEERLRRAMTAPQLVLRAVRPLYDRPDSPGAPGAAGAAWPEGSASLLDLHQQLALPLAAAAAALPPGGALQRGGSREAAWWAPQLGSHGAGVGLMPLPPPAQHAQLQEYRQLQQQARQLGESGTLGLPLKGVIGMEHLGGNRGVEEAGRIQAIPASPTGLFPVAELPAGPIEVTVAVRVGAGGGRRHRTLGGRSQDDDSRSGYTRGPSSGVFDVPRYLAGRDCIHNGSRWMSRSHFEKVGGSKMAKWYRSIRVLPDLEPLGEWLERHNMPVTKGPARRSRKRAADSGDEQAFGQDPDAADSPEAAGGIEVAPATAVAVIATGEPEPGGMPDLLAEQLLLHKVSANSGDRRFLQRLWNTLPQSQQYMLPQPEQADGAGRTPGDTYAVPMRGAGGLAPAAPVGGEKGFGAAAAYPRDARGPELQGMLGDDVQEAAEVATLRWRFRQTDRAQGASTVAPKPSPITPPMQLALQWADPQRDNVAPTLSRPDRDREREPDRDRHPAPRQQDMHRLRPSRGAGGADGAGAEEDMDFDTGPLPDNRRDAAPHSHTPLLDTRIRRVHQLGAEGPRMSSGSDEQHRYDEDQAPLAGQQRQEWRQQRDVAPSPSLALQGFAAGRMSSRDAPARPTPFLYSVPAPPGLQYYRSTPGQGDVRAQEGSHVTGTMAFEPGAHRQRRQRPMPGEVDEEAWRETYQQLQQHHPQQRHSRQQQPHATLPLSLQPHQQQLELPQHTDVDDYTVRQSIARQRGHQRHSSAAEGGEEAWEDVSFSGPSPNPQHYRPPRPAFYTYAARPMGRDGPWRDPRPPLRGAQPQPMEWPRNTEEQPPK